MPPLICGPPTILDQSFPRDKDQLKAVAVTLGEMGRQLKNNEIHLVLTTVLSQVVEEGFEWSLTESNPLLRDIYTFLNQLFLLSRVGLVRLNLSHVSEYHPHPIPNECSSAGLVDIWADEVGRLLALHDSCCPGGSYFIGIACERAYSGSTPQRYCSLGVERCFPLVGPNEISQQLIDAYVWETDPNILRQSISLDMAIKNYKVIGATCVKKTSGGSHCNMFFKGSRPCTLSLNWNPIPDYFLSQLSRIAGYPTPVIKTALASGAMPNKRLRFPIVDDCPNPD